MEIPPISEEEIVQEWAKLREAFALPEAKRYIAKNMLLIRKCFGERAYGDAMTKLRLDQTVAA